MGCNCKSSTSIKKSVSQVTKRVSSSKPLVNTEKKINGNQERKQIVIKRPLH